MLLLWELWWYTSIDKFIWGRISIVNKIFFQITKTEAATGQVDQAAGDIPVYPALSDYKSICLLCRDGIVVHHRVTPVGIHTNGCGVKRGTARLNWSELPKNKTQFPRLRLEHGPLDLRLPVWRDNKTETKKQTNLIFDYITYAWWKIKISEKILQIDHNCLD